MPETWYYRSGDAAYGPISLNDLATRASSGALAPEDAVSSDGFDWVAARSVAGLVFAAAPAGGAVAEGAGTPLYDLTYGGSADQSALVTVRAAGFIRQTTVWVRIFSIMLFVGSGLFVLLGGLVAVYSLAKVDIKALLAGLAYFAVGILYLVPALYLSRYASACKRFSMHHDEVSLESALKHQKSFWKFTAIAALVMIAGYALLFLGLFVIEISHMAAP